VKLAAIDIGSNAARLLISEVTEREDGSPQFNKLNLVRVPLRLGFDVFDKGTPVFGGKAIRKQVTIYFTKDTSDHKMDLLIYLPAEATKPAPLLLAISFSANSTVADDPGVKQGMIWRGEKKVAATASNFGKVNVEKFISNGIGYATVYYGDIEPDFKNGIKYGIRNLYLEPGTTQVAPGEWGAISAWSWGLSRAMDYLETDKNIDAKKIAVTGPAYLLDAFAAQPEDLTGLGFGRDLDIGMSIERRDLDFATQCRRGEADRHFAMQIPTLALEHRMRLQVDDDIQVAGRTAVHARFAFA